MRADCRSSRTLGASAGRDTLRPYARQRRDLRVFRGWGLARRAMAYCLETKLVLAQGQQVPPETLRVTPHKVEGIPATGGGSK